MIINQYKDDDQHCWLVRYSYSPVGDLIAVRHRHGEVVREFEWQAHMLTAHRVPGGMEAHYTWDRHAPDGPVVGQQEAGGLSRSYTYHVDHTLVTDSLGREERYHFVGSSTGLRFSLTDHDTDSLNRDWQAIEVNHIGEQPQALEEDGITQGDANGMTRYHNQVMRIHGDAHWRATPNPKPRVDGPQVAFVVGPEGEEIHCDEHGRVKVQFPWDCYAEPNDTASCWVRVAQGWAGGK
ncbi:hypothetical protein [Halomonas sp. HL-93]|uniref:hypothetical protein n=1 Tax=unclassified Halomonas TaxID=2609666 RepID=UPI0006D9D7E0|nr:MAG: Phage-related baseplate assembly protein [Halomonas sp. HL-93]SBR45218.1 hypothetical protein GA0071314_0131 [Halomonas sp. HL-93]SNY97664.1 hypothetical protein SAMN04488142_2269 [Halomonas sp. hl-4]